MSAGLGHDWRPLPPRPADATKWDEEAVTFATTQLTRVRGSAEKWSATIATLLGLFGTVALVGGSDELAGFENEYVRYAIVIILAVAGIAAGVSLIMCSMAAFGAKPRIDDNWSGEALRGHVNSASADSTAKLKAALIVGFIAAALVFAVGLAGLVNAALPPDTASSTSVLVVGDDGDLRCGRLAVDANGKATVGGQEVSGVKRISLVSKC